MDISADEFESFVCIVELGGYTEASRKLNRSQPAISRRIRQLEQTLDAPLFERTGRGVMLTQAGQALLPYAKRTLATMQDGRNAVRALTTVNAGPVALAAVGTLAGADLTAILKRFTRTYPKVDLTLRTATSVQVSNLVRSGEANIGLRYYHDPSPDLDSQLLGTERLLVTCSKEHRFAGSAVATLAKLRSERWLAFPEVPEQPEISASHVFAIFLTRGLAGVEWTPIDSLTVQKRLVEAGFGLALMPESAIREELASGTISTIRVRDLKVGTPIEAVNRRGGFLSAACRRLLEIFRSSYAAK